MNKTINKSVLKILFSIFITAAGSLYFFQFAHKGLPYGNDEGVELAAAKQILNGAVLFKDSVHSNKPAVYLLSAVFKIAGLELINARYFAAFAASLIILVLFLLSNKYLGLLKSIALCMSYIFWSFAYWNILGFDWWGTLISLLSFSCFILYLLKKENYILFISGFLCGIDSLFIQDLGFLTFISFVLYIVLNENNKLSKVIKVISGACIVWLIVILFFLSQGALQGMFKYLVWGPLFTFSYMSELYVPYPWLFKDPGNADYGRFIYIYFLPPLNILFAFIIRKMIIIKLNDQIFKNIYNILIIYTLSTFFVVFPRSDIYHLVFILPMTFLLMAYNFYILEKFVVKKYSIRFIIKACYIVLALIISLTGYLGSKNNFINTTEYTKFNKLDGILISEQNKYELNLLDKFLTENVKKDEFVFVVPDAPFIYYLFDIKNPTPYNIFIFGNFDFAMEKEAVNSLRSKNVKFIITLDLARTYDGRSFDGFALYLASYINECYRVKYSVGKYLIRQYERSLCPN